MIPCPGQSGKYDERMQAGDSPFEEIHRQIAVVAYCISRIPRAVDFEMVICQHDERRDSAQSVKYFKPWFGW